MYYHVFQVTFPLEPDEVVDKVTAPDYTPVNTARAILKTEAEGGSVPALMALFHRHATIKPGDNVEYKGVITDQEMILTLDVWMQKRNVLDPVGLLSDD